MTIFRHKKTNILYTIEHIVLDIKHTNNNENAGMYCKPYKSSGNIIHFKSKDKDKCYNFVEENFYKIAEGN